MFEKLKLIITIKELIRLLNQNFDTAEKSIRETSEGLQEEISQEITARTEADAQLDTKINTLDEKVDGININLTKQIDDLEQDVNDKYNELVRDIDDLTDVVEEDFTSVNKRIDDEITARTNADNAINEKINVIETDIATIETDIDNLESRVDTVEDNSVVKIDYNANDIGITVTYGDEETEDILFTNLATDAELQAEIIARTEADSTLNTKIDTTAQTINQRITDVADELNQTIEENVVALQQEDTALQNQINTHSQQITQEISDRQTADSNLQTQITTNTTDISELTQVVQDDYDELKDLIDQEIEDREGADNNLQEQITQEITNRQNADNALSDRIDAVESRGRFLALWNATTGLPESTPQITPYTYKTGDYYIVDAVGETNYRPTGTEFVEGQASTEIETEELTTDDVYYYDGAVWRLQVNHGKTVSFGNLTGQPSDNTALKQVLDSKQPVGDYATNTALTQGLATKQNKITNLSTIESNAEAGKNAKDIIDTYGDIVTHSANEFQPVGDYATKTELSDGLDTKQDTLVSGTNIKTLNNESLLGSGNIDITSAQWGSITGTLSNQTDLKNALDLKQNITDNNLVTTDKTVVGAVNELDAKIKEIELYKTPNVLIQGEPTINNGQVTGFSKTAYLILPFEFNVGERGFELTYAFRTGSDVTTAQNLFGSKFSIASYIQNGKLTIRVSSNGTSWDILDLITSLDVQPNTTYYIKLIFNKLDYNVKSSTDGVGYFQIGYVVDTRPPFAGDVYIGIGNNTNNPFLGMINLHKWELKYNNSVFWEGMDDAGLATRADISLSNLDEQGQAKFDTKQNKLNQGANITLTPQEDGTVTISASGGLAEVNWGGITGNIENQTDLQQALNNKTQVIIRKW